MGRSSTKHSAERIRLKRAGKRTQVSQTEEYAKAVAGTEDDLDPALEAAAIEALLNAADDK
jgi:hypothetical protein